MKTFSRIVLASLLCAPIAGHAASSEYAITNDYPKESLEAGEQGTVAYRIDINVDGKPENCVVLQSSGYARLDEATCHVILLRARFRPALDDKGVPTRSEYSGRVRWVLPAR